MTEWQKQVGPWALEMDLKLHLSIIGHKMDADTCTYVDSLVLLGVDYVQQHLWENPVPKNKGIYRYVYAISRESLCKGETQAEIIKRYLDYLELYNAHYHLLDIDVERYYLGLGGLEHFGSIMGTFPGLN
ncbi:MAG: hypothetical protein CL489_06340 [Acidobacteria bacterium]|mgnify:CR=1 FL=1|nr:hypothetical protein [Acidobacteriota bacterium]